MMFINLHHISDASNLVEIEGAFTKRSEHPTTDVTNTKWIKFCITDNIENIRLNYVWLTDFMVSPSDDNLLNYVCSTYFMMFNVDFLHT